MRQLSTDFLKKGRVVSA